MERGILSSEKKMIRKFIRENIKRILSRKLDFTELKNRKNNFFFNTLKRQYGNPNWAAIAHELIQMLVDSKDIVSQMDLDNLIQKTAFLAKAVITKIEHYTKNIVLSSNEEIAEIWEEVKKRIMDGSIETLQNAKETVLYEAKKELKSVLDVEKRKLDTEREQLDNEKEQFQSKIDPYLNEKSEILLKKYEDKIKAKSYKTRPPWWHILGLTRDPFPSLFGLTDIEQEHYEDIVVMLPIFQKYKDLVVNYPGEILNKSTLFYGEYGCGKTTLFEYLYPFFIKSQICPLPVMLDAEPTLFQLRNEFYNRLFLKLCEQIKKWRDYDPRSCNLSSVPQDLQELMKILITDSPFKGLIIYLDGLHKFDNEILLALDFLKGLQNFFEDSIQKGIKLAIFIAGSKLWIKELTHNSAYEGSISKREPFDPISAVQAYDLVLRRLKTFSTNNSFTKFISYKDIEKLMYIIQRTYPREIPFRTFIEEFINRVSDQTNGIIDLRINYDLDNESFTPIYERFRNNPEIFQKLITIRGDYKDSPQVLHTLAELLGIIEEKGTINENSEIFKENELLIAILSQRSILTRNKSQKGIIWGLEPTFRALCLEIDKTLKYRLKYYIWQILRSSEPKGVTFIESSRQIINDLERIAKGNPTENEALMKILKNIEKPYHQVLDFFEEQSRDKRNRDEIFELTKLIFHELLTYLYLLSGEEKEIKSRQDLFQEFLYTWKDNEIFRGYITLLKALEGKLILSNEDKRSFLAAFVSASDAIIKKIEKWLRYNSILRIGTMDLTNYEKDQYNSIRSFYWENRYNDCLATLWELYEKKLRDIIYNILILLYGTEWKKALPENVDRAITNQWKINQRKGLCVNVPEGNELYLCGRSHYCDIIIDTKNWENIFQALFKPIAKEKIEGFLRNLVTLVNPERHGQDPNFFKLNQQQIYSLVVEGFPILKTINTGFLKILTPKCFRETNSTIVFSYNNFKDIKDLKEIGISKDEGNRIVDSIKAFSQSKLILDISSIGDVKKHFFSDHTKVFGMIATGIREKKIKIQKVEGTNIMLIKV